MNKRPPPHPDPEMEPSIALLVRSMRTALGPADDEETEAVPEVTLRSELVAEPPVPAAGIVRIPTVVRTRRTTESSAAASTPSAVQVDRRGHPSAPFNSDSYERVTEQGDSMLSGVLRRTRHRSSTLNDADSSTSHTPVISVAAPGEPLQWDDLHDPIVDNDMEAFLQRADSRSTAYSHPDAVTEAPTPFAPETYADWSERNSRGE